MASVIVVGKHGQRREVPLEGDAVTVIGRDSAASLALGDLQVSRRHALLVKAEQGFFVKDLGSRNGILLNKLRVPSRRQARLKNGDVLSVGRTTLVFKDLGVGPSTTTTTEEPSSPTLLRIPSGPVAAVAGHELVAPAPDDGRVQVDEVDDLEELVEPAGTSARRPSGVDGSSATSDTRAATDTPRADMATRQPPKAVPSPRPPAARPVGAPPAPKPTSGRAPRTDTELARIPRALPAGAALPVSGAGSAEVLVLRALERAERERVFYRNLVLVLLGVMVVTLVALLAWAIGRGPREAAPSTETQLSVQGPAPATPVAAAQPDTLDAAAFARDVHPVLAQRCASCHSGVGRGGALVLGQGADAQTVATNLSAVRRYVVQGKPEQSALLLETLPAAEGGRDHGGGALLTMASPEWRALRDWVAGATNASATAPASAATAPTARANAAPAVKVAPIELAEVGRAVALDARESQDPDGDALRFRWTLRARPDGSSAQVSRPGEAQAELVPDVAGSYVIAVVVHDDRQPASAEVTVVAAAAAPPAADRTAAVRHAATSLLGQIPVPDIEALVALRGDALTDALAARPELMARWWQAELEHLALTGDQRPKGEPWDSIPERLRAGRVSALDALGALLVGQAFAQRHSGRDAQVRALLGRVVGLDLEAAANLSDVAGAGRMFDGHAATVLGKEGSSRADLVRIVMADGRTRRGLLTRACERASGLPLVGAKLDAAAAALEARPADFWKLVAGFATQRVPR